MSEYEQRVKSALLQTALFAAVAVISLTIALGYAFFAQSRSMKTGLLICGAVMAIAALIAQHRHKYFVALLTPNTFVTDEFAAVFLKYRKYQSVGGWAFLLLSVIGILLGLFGAIYAPPL